MADSTPTLAGFTAYCRAIPFPTAAIPDDDPGFAIALAIALQWIPQQLNALNATLYTYTVYEWGASVMIERQNDVPPSTFFADLRKAFLVDNFVPGVISSAADNGTSEGMTVGSSLSNLGIADLQRLKDPWGRRALATLQSMGPLWGLT